MRTGSALIRGLVRYAGFFGIMAQTLGPTKIMPLGVNPFRRGSYPANTASVPQSNREQRSP